MTVSDDRGAAPRGHCLPGPRPPPEGDLNSHLPWSAWDEQDIRYAVEHSKSLAETANFLCRTDDELRDKAKAMGLAFKR